MPDIEAGAIKASGFATCTPPPPQKPPTEQDKDADGKDQKAGNQ